MPSNSQMIALVKSIDATFMAVRREAIALKPQGLFKKNQIVDPAKVLIHRNWEHAGRFHMLSMVVSHDIAGARRTWIDDQLGLRLEEIGMEGAHYRKRYCDSYCIVIETITLPGKFTAYAMNVYSAVNTAR